MPINGRWRIATGVGTAAAMLAGLGTAAVASDGLDLRDRSGPAVVEPVGLVDASAESADSPGASPFDSAQSASDSPGDPGWKDPALGSADSPGPGPASGPASGPSKKKAAADSGGSADSPAPVRAPAKKKAPSDDSGWSGSSGGSAD